MTALENARSEAAVPPRWKTPVRRWVRLDSPLTWRPTTKLCSVQNGPEISHGADSEEGHEEQCCAPPSIAWHSMAWEVAIDAHLERCVAAPERLGTCSLQQSKQGAWGCPIQNETNRSIVVGRGSSGGVARGMDLSFPCRSALRFFYIYIFIILLFRYFVKIKSCGLCRRKSQGRLPVSLSN